MCTVMCVSVLKVITPNVICRIEIKGFTWKQSGGGVSMDPPLKTAPYTKFLDYSDTTEAESIKAAELAKEHLTTAKNNADLYVIAGI